MRQIFKAAVDAGPIDGSRVRLAFFVVLTLSVLDLSNAISAAGISPIGPKLQVYDLLHLPFVYLWLRMVRQDWRHPEGLRSRVVKLVREAKVPRLAKYATAVVMAGNLICIAVGTAAYPFYDVGMFRWSVNFGNAPKVVHRPKYYYWQEGQPRILDLRREQIPFLSEHLGWWANSQLTFSAAYHHKGERGTYDYLLERLRPLGAEQLWVGVHTVDYATGRVWFDPDPIRAVEINATGRIYYGPIFIPDHQRALYEAHVR